MGNTKILTQLILVLNLKDILRSLASLKLLSRMELVTNIFMINPSLKITSDKNFSHFGMRESEVLLNYQIQEELLKPIFQSQLINNLLSSVMI